jgi:hypothetical protein
MRHFARAAAAALAAVLVLVAATVLADGAMRAQKVTSIAVDGSLTDWKDVSVQPLGTTATIAAIAQDERFLYVNFSFTDLAQARRILRSGTIVWFNATGKHEPDLGLRYRGTDDLQKAYEALQEAAPEPVATPAARTGGGGGRNARQRQPLGTLEVLHHGVADTVISSGKTPDHASAACAVEGNSFIYELRIPLSEIALASPETLGGGEHTVAVGIQMSGLTPAERAAAGGNWRSRRQLRQQPDLAAPWVNAPTHRDQQDAAAAPATGSAPDATGGTPAVATPAANAGAAASSPTGPDSNPQATPTAGQGRRAFQPPTWLDVTVELPKAEPPAKQE